ncbi:hypothetical protein GCM10009541_25370 [Micromonospora gifhornensis]|uniref:Uncharacterized protein n=1 Tax=Micromonospora gifhornensis TaxID=84594 RepID=A0ABQ4IHN8_9ACTN|nr:hypothetical protein Vgi01_41150 [Micromonospora gifhornensis]
MPTTLAPLVVKVSTNATRAPSTSDGTVHTQGGTSGTATDRCTARNPEHMGDLAGLDVPDGTDTDPLNTGVWPPGRGHPVGPGLPRPLTVRRRRNASTPYGHR